MSPEARARAVEGADGDALAVTVLGEGRPVIVLAGGPGAHGPLYRECLAPLAAICRLVLFDYRGCGASARAGAYGLDRDLADVAALVERLELRQPVLLGHSYGGLLAMRYAVDRPDAVAGLVLVGPIASSSAFAEATKRKRARMNAEDRAEWEELAKRCRSREATAAELDRYWVLEAGNQVHDAQWVPRLVAGLRIDFDVLLAAQPSLRDVDLRPELEAIRAPTLVITGREDLGAGNDPVVIAEGVRVAELHRLEETGHTPFLEWNDRFIEIVTGFVGGLPA